MSTKTVEQELTETVSGAEEEYSTLHPYDFLYPDEFEFLGQDELAEYNAFVARRNARGDQG